MKPTGIVRRIDDLGRVVIPRELRRTLKMREGEPLEIFTNRDGEVILRKFSPVGELGDFAKQYCDALYESVGQIVLITDRDNVVAVAGAPKKEFLDKTVSGFVEETMEDRQSIILNNLSEGTPDQGCLIAPKDGEDAIAFTAAIIAPIIAEGDAIGSVIIASRQPKVQMGNLELKLAETAANFLAKYIS